MSKLQRHVEELSALTGRIVVIYYSGWLHVDPSRIQGTPLASDIQVVHVDTLSALVEGAYSDREIRQRGIDLVLHTPGGELNATKQLGNYLRRSTGNNLRTIVPLRAMSAGTLLACAGKSILLHSRSALGQTDPILYGVPALHWISDYEATVELVKENPPLYELMRRFPIGVFPRARNALDSTRNLLVEWLRTNMLVDEPSSVAESIAERLCNDSFGDHAMPLSLDESRQIGLKVCDFGENRELSNVILSIHDAVITDMLSSGEPIYIGV